MAALLVPVTYGVAFASFHGAGTEEVRHMLSAALLYRVAFGAGLVALLAPKLQEIQARLLARHSKIAPSTPA
jgi:hypothetical protein